MRRFCFMRRTKIRVLCRTSGDLAAGREFRHVGTLTNLVTISIPLQAMLLAQYCSTIIFISYIRPHFPLARCIIVADSAIVLIEVHTWDQEEKRRCLYLCFGSPAFRSGLFLDH